jgi:hypothetical protein
MKCNKLKSVKSLDSLSGVEIIIICIEAGNEDENVKTISSHTDKQ